MLKRYAIRRNEQNTAFIERAVFPPRMSEWTLEEGNAQLFETEHEAMQCADFIQEHAFYCETYEVEVAKNDHRILKRQKEWQEASDMVSDQWCIERTRVEIKE